MRRVAQCCRSLCHGLEKESAHGPDRTGKRQLQQVQHGWDEALRTVVVLGAVLVTLLIAWSLWSFASDLYMGTGGLELAGYAFGKTWTRHSQYRAKCHATTLLSCASSRRCIIFEECMQYLNWYSVVPAGHKDFTQGQIPLQQLCSSFDQLSQRVPVLLDGSRYAARGSHGWSR